MELRKLFPRVLLATLALSILSVSAFAQTRPRVANGGDVNEVSCSPDEFAVLASAEPAPKPAWEAKPKPVIDVAPSPSSSSAGFIKFEPLLMNAIDQVQPDQTHSTVQDLCGASSRRAGSTSKE